MPRDAARDTSERERLEKLITRLSDHELRQDLGDGWTVAAILAHLAYYDRRAVVLIERWRQHGVSPSHNDPHEVNDAMKEQWLALEPRVAADLAVRAARDADAAISRLSEELARDMEAKQAGVSLQRAEHRAEHLDQIEASLR
jgi:DinB family protein